MKIDVFKRLKLVRPVVCGLVMRITSPKGIRELNEITGLYHYNLHTDLKQIYSSTSPEATELSEGLYWVVDIAKTKNLGMNWNHYLLKITDNDIEILESYLDVNGTDWIPTALPTIKEYFRAHR